MPSSASHFTKQIKLFNLVQLETLQSVSYPGLWAKNNWNPTLTSVVKFQDVITYQVFVSQTQLQQPSHNNHQLLYQVLPSFPKGVANRS